MADTPTGDTKPQVEDGGRAREGSHPDRRRRGRGGQSKKGGAGEAGDQARGERRDRGERSGERSQERAQDQGRGERSHEGRGEQGSKPKGKGRRDDRRDRDRGRGDQPLTAGLFAGVADRQMPCRVAGCKQTWTWYGTQQIRSLGKPEPKRMCDEHLAEFEGIEDRQMPCRNSWCTNTWPWSRAAQLYQRERQDKPKPPHRLCDQCFEEEKTTEDLEVPCKIPECKQTWLWPRQAQLRHRAWVRRQQAKFEAEEVEEAAGGQPAVEGEHEHAEHEAIEAEGSAAESLEAEPAESLVDVEPAEDAERAEALEAEPAEDAEQAESAEAVGETEAAAEPSADDAKPDKRRKRKRKRKHKLHDGPPERLCERCFERAGHLEPIEVPCKVHGCSQTWVWEREGQLRAWAVLDGRDDVTELPQPPRRMCNSCFEFVRAHADTEVVCGRPGCEKTWTYKTGAQLQDFLAGRSLEPLRLCEECARSQFVVSSSRGVTMPAGAEIMPCQISGCRGSWVYAPGMRLAAADPDAEEPPVDRMCDDCRAQRGAPARDPRRMASTGDDAAGDEEAPHEEAPHEEASPDPTGEIASESVAGEGEGDGNPVG